MICPECGTSLNNDVLQVNENSEGQRNDSNSSLFEKGLQFFLNSSFVKKFIILWVVLSVVSIISLFIGKWAFIAVFVYVGWNLLIFIVNRKRIYDFKNKVIYCIIFMLLLYISYRIQPTNIFSNSYDRSGYNYVVNHLNSPSSAKMVSYISKSKIRSYAKENWNITYSSDLDFEEYDIEAMNGFGGMVRDDFTVVFWKGEPIYMDNVSVPLWLSTPHNRYELGLLLDLNCGLSSEKLNFKNK